MYKNKTKKIILTLILILIFTITGCGSKYQAVKPNKDPKKIVVDTNYTKDLKSETGVQYGQVYIQNGMAIATMILNDKISDKDAKILAEKYANEIKKTYKNMKVNVQAVKNGKNVANILLK